MTETTLRRYHEETKHRPGRPSPNPYGLDWRNEPELFKGYRAIGGDRPPEDLARLLELGVGVHPRRGSTHYRTYMSAGALHPVELYVATSAGLFHYHPGEGTLRRLRPEDPRAALSAAVAAPELAHAGFVLILTGVLWRTAWKYGARGWRHIFWDAGAMLANLLALAGDRNPRLLTAFSDEDVGDVLGLESRHETPVALLAAGEGERASAPRRLERLRYETAPLSQREHRFAAAEEADVASALRGAGAVRAWRLQAEGFASRGGGGGPPTPLDEVILRRGSARDFTLDGIGRDEVASVLAWATTPVTGDLPPACSTFVIAHAVDGLAPGIYRFESPDRFEAVARGADRRLTANLCLDQPLGGRAAATIFFTVDLDRVLSVLGGRGYRAGQLDAGITAGRASLGAYARGLGATGLTFYDDEVRRYLGTEEEPMMCLATGVDARRPWLRRARDLSNDAV